MDDGDPAGFRVRVEYLEKLEEPVVLETDSFRLAIGRDGILQSLTDKPGGTEYACKAPSCPVAAVYRGGRPVPASFVVSAAFSSHVDPGELQRHVEGLGVRAER